MGIAAAAGFARRMGTGHRAGADLLMLLGAEAKGGTARYRQAMLSLIDGVKDGVPLSKSMEAEQGFFPNLLVSLARVGEMTGRFERTMFMAADHYDHRVAVRRDFLKGIAWPLLQLFAAVFVIALMILLLGILTPAGGGEMADMTGLGLRGPGGALIFLSLVGLAFACVAAVVFAIRRNFLGCHNLIPLFYMIPKLGPAIRTITLARFTWVLSLTLDTGLDPIRSVALAFDSTDSDYYRGGIQPASEAIQRGQSLANSLRVTDILPDDFLVQLEVAELSGTDAESLQTLALEYDQRAQMAIKTLSVMLSVAIWLTVAIVLIAMIINIAMRIVGVYSDAMEPI